MKRLLFIIVLSSFCTGCLHTVKYSLTEKDRWTGAKISGTVYVQPFTDKTQVETTDWRKWQPVHISNQVWRVNYRGGYKETNLTGQVTAMITKHLSYSGLFTKGISGSETNADFVLSGTLVDFQARGRVNKTAENVQAVSAGFGLLGALVGSAATEDMKSEIKTAVKLDGLNLNDRMGQTLWRDSISISNDVAADFEEAGQDAIFNYPDQALKEAVTEMIHRLGNSSLTNRTAGETH